MTDEMHAGVLVAGAFTIGVWYLARLYEHLYGARAMPQRLKWTTMARDSRAPCGVNTCPTILVTGDRVLIVTQDDGMAFGFCEACGTKVEAAVIAGTPVGLTPVDSKAEPPPSNHMLPPDQGNAWSEWYLARLRASGVWESDIGLANPEPTRRH